ncbi:fimbrial protein [Stenotrophomonas sp. DDT-1]|nr:fimbrial protein [Stenotrophomonas sp. DDT-1]MBN5108954.1 fimbrial protein [Stenotrophomonas maltophilia]PSD19264.1 fimbrial protein [Stenotrophomonas maltophilia]QGL82481.1 fimbrial protein [Stenotrophomonas maltophilia]
MDCGVARPRADMVLMDAGDAGNTGSLLTPSADSTAEGVRVQLLSGGREVQFGTPWFFNPGVGGVHTFEYTARYLRVNEDLKPGLIKGEAVLNVVYW